MKVKVLILGLGLFLAHACFAQVGYAQTEEEKDKVRKILKDISKSYAVVVHASTLENKCKTLPNDSRRALSENSAYSSVKMVNIIGFPARMIKDLTVAAQSFATKQKCNGDEKLLIMSGWNVSIPLRAQLASIEEQILPGQKVLGDTNNDVKQIH